MKTFKIGDKGPLIKALQSSLNKAGTKPALKTDSIFGNKTETALKTFQKKNRLKADGIADAKTQKALQSGSGGKPQDLSKDWPIKQDLVELRRDLGENLSKFMDPSHKARQAAKKSPLHLGLQDRVLNLEDTEKEVTKLHNAASDALTKIMLMHEKFLNTADEKQRAKIGADAQKALAGYSKAFYKPFLDKCGSLKFQYDYLNDAIKRVSAITWPFPSYDATFAAERKKFQAIRRPMHELLSVCAKQPIPKIQKFAQEADKVYTRIEKVFDAYEHQFATFGYEADKFQLAFGQPLDDRKLKAILAKGKKDYATLLKMAKEFKALLSKCVAAIKAYEALKKQGFIAKAA